MLLAMTVRNAAAEADAALGAGYVARVLEPSPPAVLDDAFFADDPTRRTGDGVLVGGPDGLPWVDAIADRADLTDWATARHLLGSPLPALPANLVAERRALHRLATYVIAPARHQANGKFGLRWTLGGFGTPFLRRPDADDDVQIRVEGNELVLQSGDSARRTAITSMAAAAAFLGSEIDAEVATESDSPPLGDVDADLGISAETVAFLDRWWGTATAALERLRDDEASVAPSRVQLWPGHFDPAIEVGDDNRRASIGGSPGDDSSDEPYLYVSAWWPDRLVIDDSDGFWNAEGYTGALLPLSALAGEHDPIGVALDFFREGRDRLAAAPDA